MQTEKYGQFKDLRSEELESQNHGSLNGKLKDLEREIERLATEKDCQLKELSGEIAIVTSRLREVEEVKQELVSENTNTKKAN